jgi:16S rRNA (guanine527-N7)-methyltransferase
METSPALFAALGDAQRVGLLGARPIDEVIEHARGFVNALESTVGAVVDLGAGGGVPGLVIAHDRPDLTVTLIDRRAKRTDFLERIVRRLGWAGRVDVVAADVRDVVVSDGARFDGAVARGFGPPSSTLQLAVRLVRPGGVVVMSEPPDGDRWSDDPLVQAAAVIPDFGIAGVVRFQVRP